MFVNLVRCDVCHIEMLGLGLTCWVGVAMVVFVKETTRKVGKMKVRDLSPLVTRFNATTTKRRVYKASTWQAVDYVDSDVFGKGIMVREIWHYSTHMGTFSSDGGAWKFEPVSIGWGSVSDQKGMNQIMEGIGFRYVRKGGARYTHCDCAF